MRIWSLHPKYLDAKGLVALWRETLLAKHVLEGKTKGYKHHPQLTRFRNAKYPLDCINQYLNEVYLEAEKRKYNFDREKIDLTFRKSMLTVTSGQMKYELRHLLNKLEIRDHDRYKELSLKEALDSHPVFKLIEGEIENWEIIDTKLKRLSVK